MFCAPETGGFFFSIDRKTQMASSSPNYLQDWNKENPNRIVPFGPDERFSDSIVCNRRVNQYTKSSDVDAFLNSAYQWLIANTELKKNKTGHFTCWKPNKTSGIDDTTAGYKRMSFNGKKVLCHVLVWLFHHPGESLDGDDVSHRCQNKWCCRPSHLVKEDRSTNKSRDNCLGYLIEYDDPEIVIKLCKHEPPCCTSVYFSQTSDTVVLQPEQWKKKVFSKEFAPTNI